MKTEIETTHNSSGTEILLQDLIAECHAIIREVVLPAARQAEDGFERIRYLNAAMELVKVGALAGDSVSRLRQPVTVERRQRIVVERIESGRLAVPPDAPGEGPEEGSG